MNIKNTVTSKKRESASVSWPVKHKKLCTEKINSSSSEFLYSESQFRSIGIDSENDSEEDTGVPEQVCTPPPKTRSRFRTEITSSTDPSVLKYSAHSQIHSSQNQKTPCSPTRLYSPKARPISTINLWETKKFEKSTNSFKSKSRNSIQSNWIITSYSSVSSI